MTDTSTTTGPNKKTVAAAANQCLESFNKCLLQQSSIHPREFSLVEDQVARFSTWTSGIGVFAPGRASMDHRLRYAPEVQSITISLLESLNYRIQKLLELLHSHLNDPETQISSVLDERLGKFLGYIATEISHLNKMSNIIRKASQDSQNIQAKDFHLTDEEGNDVQPILLSHYKRYISEGFPTASVTIQQRLADAMILRRKRILYRRSRYGGTAIQLPKVETKVSIALPDSLLQLEDNQKAIAPSRIKSATTLQPEKFKMATSSPSVVSATMTVALGNHEALKFPTAPGLHAKRKYEQFKAEQLAAHHAMMGKADEPSSAADPTLDDAVDMRDAKRRLSTEQQLSKVFKPDVPAIGEVTCPYCFYTLSLEEVFNEKKWHNHVKNDLDPYVCLFEECSEPDELYKHSEKWLSHMHQHIQRWRCPSHRGLGLFPTCEGYMQHVRDVHDTKLNDSKLRALANRNARSLPKLFMSCPLCGKDESEIDTRLTDHITGHLRSLAIMSLPIHYDEDIPGDVGSDKNGSDGSQPRSRSTINLLDDEDIFVIQSADDGNLDDIAEPSTAVDAATSDEEDVMDMLFQQDNNHIDLVQRSEHFKVNEAEIISPEPSDGQNGTESNIQLENETSQLTQEPIQRMIADATSIPTSTSVIAPALTSSSHPPVSEQQSLASQQSEKSKLLYPKLDALRKARGLDPLESTRLRRGVLDVDSDDTDMWNPQQEQTHAPDEEDSSDIAGPLNEQDMVPNKSQCWECQRRGTLCDGKIPICDNCSDAGMVCPGYNDARPLTWLPTSKVSRLQKAESESGPSSNRSDLGKSDIGNRYPLSSFQRIWDGVVGDDPRAEALRESTIPQQMHKPTPGQLQQIVYQYLVQNTSPMNDINWQSRYSVNQRMGKTLDLISNISLAIGTGRLDWNRATNFSCHFEREVFHKSPTEEEYSQAMANKIMNFFKKRQANERYLQNNTGTNTQAQAQAHGQAQVQVETQAYVPAQFRQAQAQQAQAQMGRGKVTSQNLFTNTSSTPVTSSDNISPKVPLGVDQAAAKFVDKEVHRGVPNPHNATIDDMLADLTPEQRQSILELPKETLDGVWRRWQSNRQHLMQAMNRNSRIQPQMASQPQSMPQKNAAGVSNQQQPQAERIDVNNQSPVDESMVGYTEDLNEDASSTVDVESNRRFNSMHELLTEHIKEKDRMLEVARGELEETQPESIRRFQYQHNRSRRSRSPPFDIDKRMVSYVEDVDEDAGSITGVESTRRYARSSLPRSSEPSNIGKTRMPESGIGDEIASSISSPSPYFDGTPAPYRDHHRDPQDSREPRARAPLDPAVLTWPSEDDHGEGNHKKSQLRLKNGGSRDSRDLKDLSNPRGPKKAQRDSTKHATTQPVISQSNHRRGQFEDPAAYGVQQSQQLQQAAASGRPRAKSRPASYYAAQPPRPPLDMGWPGPYAPLPPPPGAFGMRPDPFFGGPWPTEPSEALQVSDQEMMHIRNQKSVSIMNAAASGFQSGNEQIVVTEAASAASDSEASFANPEPSSSMPTSTNRSDRKQPLAEDPSWTIICDLCNRRFLHHKSLNRHYWSVHTQEEFFECSECGRMFPHRDDLAQHARIHTGGAIVKNRIEDPTP